MAPHVAFDPDQWLHLRIQPVAHKLKLAVRRDEADGAIILESAQPDTLVEFHVLHLHRFPPRCPPRRLEHDLVVQSQSQLGHAAEVAFQLHGAEDLGAENVACGGDEEVEGLDDVEEDFVFAVADSFRAPGDGVGHGDGGSGLDFEFVGFLRYVSGDVVSYVESSVFFSNVDFSSRTSRRFLGGRGNWQFGGRGY